ncbi:CobW/HypB/UreG, nucleotide-binding domain [Lachnospiraceae bacterium XBD2001]|nr:CobW/HypB/UreG, nucleotide-binding domain [Lachnospiraceae bacterium XBD2001]
MQEVPVYVFYGFMDSGKTTLVQETLFQNDFANDLSSFLVIRCEDGDEEYDEKKLTSLGGRLITIDNEEDFTAEYMKQLDDEFHPEAIFIEYNGTWEVAPLYEMEGPESWTIVQALCTVDASTFEMYMQNMRVMMSEQMFKADVVIFNRCTDATPKAKFRANVKSVNRRCQIVYEREDGTVDDSEEELPFDINADEIEISDADYALWFMDCMDHPKKYDGKIISFLGLVYNPTDGKGKLKPGVFVPGRFAMTCCVEDIQFLGMKTVYKDSAKLEHKSWIQLKAQVKYEFAKEYRGKGPVLHPIEITPAEKPEDELVYFS